VASYNQLPSVDQERHFQFAGPASVRVKKTAGPSGACVKRIPCTVATHDQAGRVTCPYNTSTGSCSAAPPYPPTWRPLRPHPRATAAHESHSPALQAGAGPAAQQQTPGTQGPACREGARINRHGHTVSDTSNESKSDSCFAEEQVSA
jgi:hypothetical protein